MEKEKSIDSTVQNKVAEKPTKLDILLTFLPIPVIAEKKTIKIIRYSDYIDKREPDKDHNISMHLGYGAVRYAGMPVLLYYAGVAVKEVLEKLI